ncbi:Cytochrome c biogenesis protein, transmembrane region [Micrococcus luteus]|uniref:Cytochrome c biogenesis CcdA family protein n=1 Tax=Nesterenkonia massiliensis TaxID=1232429 RepID=A0ABT2HQK6_9MICC|nr:MULTISPECIES: cytochrome c biogenesis CcdA family protein [Micrococcaceae]EZP32911.1 Cytochrome c biogenesis protein, transmembrane region [Micrococcus luteus]MCT1606959.1 cytochrome c biogenesis CcdA family protein [Nesterenkonia massiliensis]MCV7696234.1 cytochrome c biogenesis CcdA family protein [Micrococcus luteus]CVN70906.1 cytochrome c-type biogenesis protein [Streptococcus pneumoniae]
MNPSDLVFDGALWVGVLLAVLAGFVSFASPCVLPLVPGYFGYLSSAVASDGSIGTAAEGTVAQRRRLLLGVLLFIAGFSVVFVSVTVLGGVFGRVFISYADIATRILGAVVILMGLAFVGVFRRAQRTIRPRFRARLGLAGAPLLGLALGIGWTPCIGPTLAAILSVSWNLGDPIRAGVLGVSYSLGLGIPFVLLALGLGWAARSMTFLRRHIRGINIAGGVVLVLLGLLMVTGLWTRLMSSLQGVMANVQLPL